MLYALFLALLGALGAYGYLAAEKTMAQANPQMILVNRAQAMAYVGVAAIQNWYDNQLYTCFANKQNPCPALDQYPTASTTSNLSGTLVSVTATTYSANGEYVVRSTGTAANGVQQVLQAVLSPETATNTTGLTVPNYTVYGTQVIVNGGSQMTSSSSIGADNLTMNGNIQAGVVNAQSATMNGNDTLSEVKVTNSLTSNDNVNFPVYLGNNASYFNNGNSGTVQHLSQQETEQLNNAIAAAAPNISASGLQQYAGLQLLNGQNDNGEIVVSQSESWQLNQLLPSGYQEIEPGSYDGFNNCNFTQSNACNEINSIEAAFCGGNYCLQYQNGFGWSVNGGIPTGFSAFLFVQGGFSTNGNLGSTSSPNYLTIVSNGDVTLNGTAGIQPYADQPGLCTNPETSMDPVCSNGTPNPALIGLAIVSGHSGTIGVNVNGQSTILGDIASVAGITINGGSTVNGRILSDNQVTLNGNVGNAIKGSNSATFNGNQQTKPEVMVLQGIRWTS